MFSRIFIVRTDCCGFDCDSMIVRAKSHDEKGIVVATDDICPFELNAGPYGGICWLTRWFRVE